MNIAYYLENLKKEEEQFNCKILFQNFEKCEKINIKQKKQEYKYDCNKLYEIYKMNKCKRYEK
jgi:hypothetical protein